MGIDISNNTDVDGSTPDAIQGRLGATINVMSVASQRLTTLQGQWVPPGPNTGDQANIVAQFNTIISTANNIISISNKLLATIQPPT